MSGKERNRNLSSPSSLCVSLRDLKSLVIRKTQLPALGQEMLPSSAPHLAATEQIQIYPELGSGKRQELCHPLSEGSLPLLMPHKPWESPSSQSPPPHPTPCPSLPFDKSEPGHDARAKACWSWASLRGWTMKTLPRGSLAH